MTGLLVQGASVGPQPTPRSRLLTRFTKAGGQASRSGRLIERRFAVATLSQGRDGAIDITSIGEGGPLGRLAWMTKRLYRSTVTWGPGNTMVKAFGRLRLDLPRLRRARADASISILGCGQMAFANICYHVKASRGRRFLECFDPDPRQSRSLERFYSFVASAESAEALINNQRCEVLYIASNHASHTAYAISGLDAGKTVYVEKPIATTWEQLHALRACLARHPEARMFVGYNRPFSPAIRLLRARYAELGEQGPVSLSCFVIGHFIAPDHWYKLPEEGTRVCGNLGHWIDLVVHMSNWGRFPEKLTIDVVCADAASPDDNMIVCISSDRGDIAAITFTSRAEPFDGVQEEISFQSGNLIAKIHDFKKIELRIGHRREVKRYWPKKAGHREAILAPFSNSERPLNEVMISGALVLHVTDLVRDGGGRRRLATDISRGTCTTLP